MSSKGLNQRVSGGNKPFSLLTSGTREPASKTRRNFLKSIEKRSQARNHFMMVQLEKMMAVDQPPRSWNEKVIHGDRDGEIVEEQWISVDSEALADKEEGHRQDK